MKCEKRAPAAARARTLKRTHAPRAVRPQTPHNRINSHAHNLHREYSRLPLQSRFAPYQAKRVPPPVRKAALRRRSGAALGRACRARRLVRGRLAQVRLQEPKEVAQICASLRTHCDERLRVAKLCCTKSTRADECEAHGARGVCGAACGARGRWRAHQPAVVSDKGRRPSCCTPPPRTATGCPRRLASAPRIAARRRQAVG